MNEAPQPAVSEALRKLRDAAPALDAENERIRELGFKGPVRRALLINSKWRTETQGRLSVETSLEIEMAIKPLRELLPEQCTLSIHPAGIAIILLQDPFLLLLAPFSKRFDAEAWNDEWGAFKLNREKCSADDIEQPMPDGTNLRLIGNPASAHERLSNQESLSRMAPNLKRAVMDAVESVETGKPVLLLRQDPFLALVADGIIWGVTAKQTRRRKRRNT
jgi:hypothetical protein